MSLTTQKAALEKKTSASGYEKTPDHVQTSDREKAAKTAAELQAVEAALQSLSL